MCISISWSYAEQDADQHVNQYADPDGDQDADQDANQDEDLCSLLHTILLIFYRVSHIREITFFQGFLTHCFHLQGTKLGWLTWLFYQLSAQSNSTQLSEE